MEVADEDLKLGGMGALGSKSWESDITLGGFRDFLFGIWHNFWKNLNGRLCQFEL